MNYNKYISLAILVILSLSACQPKESQNQDKQVVKDRELPAEEQAEKLLHDEIMAVHDEVMPKMDVIMSIKGELLEKLDSLRDLPEVPASTVEKLESGVKSLENADESMMSWMRQWSPPGDSVSHNSKLRYYNQQKVKMNTVRDDMLNSIDSAKLLLESLN